MSTRATIIVRVADTYRAIYTHWDGYPDHHLPILTEHYNTQELAERLVSLGDLSSLSSSPDLPSTGHSFENPVPGYCVAYGRDRGEADTEYRVYDSLNEAIREERQKYIYVWDGSQWNHRSGI